MPTRTRHAKRVADDIRQRGLAPAGCAQTDIDRHPAQSIRPDLARTVACGNLMHVKYRPGAIKFGFFSLLLDRAAPAGGPSEQGQDGQSCADEQDAHRLAQLEFFPHHQT